MPLLFNGSMAQLLMGGQLASWVNQRADMTLDGQSWVEKRAGSLNGAVLLWDAMYCVSVRNPLWYDAESKMRGMYRNTEQDNIPLNEVASIYLTSEYQNISIFAKERPWSSKERIGISEEGAKRKKFSSETHYWWAKWVKKKEKNYWWAKWVLTHQRPPNAKWPFFRHLNSGLRFLLTLVLILTLAFFTCATFIAFCRKCDEEVS